MRVSALSSPLMYCSCEFCSKLYFTSEFDVEESFDNTEKLLEHIIEKLSKMEVKGTINCVPNKPFLCEYMYISFDNEYDILYVDTTSSDYFLVPPHQTVE